MSQSAAYNREAEKAGRAYGNTAESSYGIRFRAVKVRVVADGWPLLYFFWSSEFYWASTQFLTAETQGCYTQDAPCNPIGR